MESTKMRAASLIVWWHRHFGIEMAMERLSREDYVAYRDDLEHLGALAADWPPEKIARKQLAGTWECFCTEDIPASMVRESGLHDFFAEVPSVTLLQLAEFVLHTPDSEDICREDDVSPFSFPHGWEKRPVHIEPAKKPLAHDERGRDHAVAAAYEGAFREICRYGMGGTSLMVAMHRTADCFARHSGQETQGFLFTPASFGFQLATGEDTLASRVLAEEVSVGAVVVGVTPDWAISGNEVKHDN